MLHIGLMGALCLGQEELYKYPCTFSQERESRVRTCKDQKQGCKCVPVYKTCSLQYVQMTKSDLLKTSKQLSRPHNDHTEALVLVRDIIDLPVKPICSRKKELVMLHV